MGALRRIRDLSPLLGPVPPEQREDSVQRQKMLRVRGRSVAWVPPLLLLIGIGLADWNTSDQFRIISWIVLVPGIAAAICGVWTTALFACLSVITYIEVDASWQHQYRIGLSDFILLSVGSVLAVLACGVRIRGERRMLHMMDVAATTRRAVLRPMPPGWGGLDHAAVPPPTARPGSAGTSSTSSRAPAAPGCSSAMCRARGWARWRRRPRCSAPSERRRTTNPP